MHTPSIPRNLRMTLIACLGLTLYGCKSPSGGQSGGIPMPQIPGAPQSSIPGLPGIPSGGGLPGGQPSSPGGLPGGSSSLPGGAPGIPGMPGGKPGGKPGGEGTGDGKGDGKKGKGKEGGSQTAGAPGSPGGGSSGAPGGTQGNTSEQGDWLDNSKGAGDDGWATSNTLPEGKGSETTGQADTTAPPTGGKLDEALDKALDDFDGEILEEREAIAKRTRQGGSTFPGGTPGTKTSAPGGNSAGGANDTASLPNERAAPRSPGGPVGGDGRFQRDTPDAKGDDAFARQLREAAANETDPELQEKLWAEYKLYKGGS